MSNFHLDLNFCAKKYAGWRSKIYVSFWLKFRHIKVPAVLHVTLMLIEIRQILNWSSAFIFVFGKRFSCIFADCRLPCLKPTKYLTTFYEKKESKKILTDLFNRKQVCKSFFPKLFDISLYKLEKWTIFSKGNFNTTHWGRYSFSENLDSFGAKIQTSWA